MAGKALFSLFAPSRSILATGVFLALLLPVAVGAGQVPQQPANAPSAPRLPGDVLSDTPNPLANPEKLEHMREDERHKRLLADTARLVELSNELQSDVEKAPRDALSLDVVRKAAEIEKLAHDVKERMKS